MTVDTSKIKKGDKITIHLIADGTSTSIVHGLYARAEFSDRKYFVNHVDIVDHTPAPRPTVVGSPVRHYGALCTVVGLHNGLAWVRFKSGTYDTVPEGSLTHDDEMGP